MHNTYLRKIILQQGNLLKKQISLGTNQCVLWKEKTKGYRNMDLNNCVTNIAYVWMSLKVTLKDQYFWNTPNLEYFSLVIQV